MKPGITILDLNVSSTVKGWSPSAALTSSRLPVATIRFPATATASAIGLAASMVMILAATKTVTGGAAGGPSRPRVICSFTSPSARAGRMIASAMKGPPTTAPAPLRNCRRDGHDSWRRAVAKLG